MGKATGALLAGILFVVFAGPAWAEEGGGDSVSSALDEFLAQDRLTGEWFGVRTTLDDAGFEFNGDYTYDLTRLEGGGLNGNNWAGRYWLNLNLGLDLEKIVGLPGARIFAAYWQMGGEYGSVDVGAWHEISSIESPDREEFAELYLEQTFLESFRAKVGKMDVAYDFAYSDYTDDFVNLGEGWPPNLVGMPTYSDPACGGAVFYEPEEGPQFGIGAFDGSGSEGVKTGIRGAGTLFGPPSAWYCIAEAGWRGEVGCVPVRPYAGAWLHTGDHEEFSGRTRNGTIGAYGGIDLTLWAPEEAEEPEAGTGSAQGDEAAPEEAAEAEEEEDADLGLHLFLRYTDANEQVAGVERHYVAGLCYWGPFEGRESDTTGLAYMYADLSEDKDAEHRHDSEQVIEFYYKLQLTAFLSVSPTFQVIINPGGAAPDAYVYGVRVFVTF